MRARWENKMKESVFALLEDLNLDADSEHLIRTPERFIEALNEHLGGYRIDPLNILKKGFEEHNYDQMLFELDIPFVSHCTHHIAPFFGKVHFGYLPHGKIVGLSKISRLVDCLSRRLQIQEKLSNEIVDTFQAIIQPHGCGVVIEAQHFCVSARGIRSVGAITKTQALRGSFMKDQSQKQEFLAGAKSRGGNLL